MAYYEDRAAVSEMDAFGADDVLLRALGVFWGSSLDVHAVRLYDQIAELVA